MTIKHQERAPVATLVGKLKVLALHSRNAKALFGVNLNDD
jgi:hypothetical protein